ncbi:MAG: GntR family transcriptional regulator [Bacillota bacterium]
MKSVRRDDATPMYLQIATEIRSAIESREVAEGASLGSQMELAERYGVSRITIRQAVELLVKDGLVTTRQGKGTYVRSTSVSQELGDLVSLSEVLEARGTGHCVQVCEMRWVFPSASVAEFFGLGSDEPVLLIKRLHLHNDRPMALAVVYLPPWIGGGFSQGDLESRSLYVLLEERLGIQVGQGRQQIRAVAAEGDVAKLLQVGQGSPLLWAERRTYSTQNQPVEHITFYYLAEAYQFSVYLKRAGDSLAPSSSPATR